MAISEKVMRKVQALSAQYGQPGEAIAGSHLTRWYCEECGEPIRVVSVPGLVFGAKHTGETCHECSGAKRRLTPGGYAGPRDDDADGSWGNVQRAVEGR